MRSIFFFGNDLIEIVKGEFFVGISLIEDMSVVHHFDDLFIIHGLAKFSANSFDFIEVYDSLLLLVVESEYSIKTIFCFCVTQFSINDFKEIVVVYAFAFLLKILDHCKN